MYGPGVAVALLTCSQRQDLDREIPEHPLVLAKLTLSLHHPLAEKL